MYPTLYHFFYDVFGVQWHWMKLLNSFGFFVAMAFVVGSMILSRELKRKGEEGILAPERRKVIIGKPINWTDVVINGFIGFIFGWKVIYLLMNASSIFVPGELPQKHIFSGEGNIFFGIILAAAFAAWRWYDYKKQMLPEPIEKEVLFYKYQYTGSITMVAAVWGVIGSKLFHLFENPKEFMQFFTNPGLESFLSGLTIYGGLIIGGLAVYIFSRKKGIHFGHLADATAPGLILAYGIGRMGCHTSGDGDWGIANTHPKPNGLTWLPDWLWSYHYPNNVNGVLGPQSGGYSGVEITSQQPWEAYEGYGTFLDPGVYPTPLYETIMTIIIFGILWSLRKRLKVPGMLFGVYLIFNGIERFFIEKIRVNNVFDFLGMEVTQAEVISTLVFIGGVALTTYLWKKDQNKLGAA